MTYNIETFPSGKKCDKCGRDIMAYTFLDGQTPILIECECKKAEREEQEKNKKEYEWLKRIDKLVKESGMPPKQKEMTFDNFNDRPGTEKAKAAAVKFEDKFFEMKKGLLFIGPCGSGKTHLACAIGNSLLHNGVRVKFTTATELFEKIRNTYNVSEKSESEVIDNYRKCKLLIIDDIGVDAPTEWSKSVLHSIIDYRMNYFLPTILTTNLNEHEMNEKLDSRTVDRISEGFYAFSLSARSFRKEKNEKS